MVKRKRILGVAIAVILCTAALLPATDNPPPSQPQVSGRLADGFRVLTVARGQGDVLFRVYRGDYLKFAYDPALGDPILAIPALSVRQRLAADVGRAPYFKMKATGVFAFSLGPITGRIEVFDYRQAHYREVTAEEAAHLIETHQPLILDVRTPAEFARGHLYNARLIPVQEIERRLHEIAAYKDREILVYCATGNRSTVASKIMNDHGFKRVSNLRHGIVQWAKDRRPVVR